MTEDQTLQLLDHLVASLGKTLGDQNARIRALEKSAGIKVLPDIDFNDSTVPDGTFATHRGGLWRFEAERAKWNALTNSVHSVEVQDKPTGARIILEMTDGERVSTDLSFAKTRKKAVAV